MFYPWLKMKSNASGKRRASVHDLLRSSKGTAFLPSDGRDKPLGLSGFGDGPAQDQSFHQLCKHFVNGHGLKGLTFTGCYSPSATWKSSFADSVNRRPVHRASSIAVNAANPVRATHPDSGAPQRPVLDGWDRRPSFIPDKQARSIRQRRSSAASDPISSNSRILPPRQSSSNMAGGANTCSFPRHLAHPDRPDQQLDPSASPPALSEGNTETDHVPQSSSNPITLADTTGTSQVPRNNHSPVSLAGVIGANHILQTNPRPYPPGSGYRPHHLNQFSIISTVPGSANIILMGGTLFGLYYERQRR